LFYALLSALRFYLQRDLNCYKYLSILFHVCSCQIYLTMAKKCRNT